MVRLILVLMLMALPFSVQATLEEAGRVLMATVGVTAQQADGSVRELSRRSSVYEGDLLRTPEGGRMQLRMADGEMISLTASSELRIEHFQYDPAADDGEAANVKRLLQGGLRTLTGAVGGDAYRIESRAGTIGIRGTAFDVLTNGDDLHVLLHSGSIQVGNEQGQVVIEAGTPQNAVSIVAPNQPPQAIPASELPTGFQQQFGEAVTLAPAGEPQEQEAAGQPSTGQQDMESPVFAAAGEPGSQPSPDGQNDQPIMLLAQTDMQPNIDEPDPVDLVSTPVPEGYFGLLLGKGEPATASGPMRTLGSGFFQQPMTVNGPDGVNPMTVRGQSGTRLSGADQSIPEFFADIYIGEPLIIGDARVYLVSEMDIHEPSFGYSSLIFSDQVMTELAMLPTQGEYTYFEHQNGGFINGENQFRVDFATGGMVFDFNLEESGGSQKHAYSGTGLVADFYNNSIRLTGNGYVDVTGRFVGSEAQGAILGFIHYLEDDPESIIGVMAFDRTVTP